MNLADYSHSCAVEKVQQANEPMWIVREGNSKDFFKNSETNLTSLPKTYSSMPVFTHNKMSWPL